MRKRHKFVIDEEYVTKKWKARAFQFTDETTPMENYPTWFRKLWEEGRVAMFGVSSKGPYFELNNKRTKGYKCFIGDWIVDDEFGHLHAVSQNTYYDRYERP
jgi:hypothetical protein